MTFKTRHLRIEKRDIKAMIKHILSPHMQIFDKAIALDMCYNLREQFTKEKIPQLIHRI